MKSAIIVAIVAGLLVPSLCFAAPKKKPAEKVQRMTFKDDRVTAGREMGGGSLIKGQLRMRFSKLIKPRAHFIPELIRSAEDI
jgi:hypothetical protein